MSKRYHLQISVRGALKRSDRALAEEFTQDGQQVPGHKIREELMNELQQGHVLIPACSPEECPDFDPFGGGCPGHEEED